MILVASIVGIALVVAQALAWLGFLKFVNRFGQYTDSHEKLSAALLATHESNLLLHQSNLRLLEQLKSAQQDAREKVA